jgi:hypothetical protein
MARLHCVTTFVVTRERSTKVNVRTRHHAVKAASLIVALAGATSFSLATPAAASAPAGAAYAVTVAPRPPDTPIIGSPPPNGGTKPKTVPVEPGAYRLRTATNVQVRLGQDSSVAAPSTTDKDVFPDPKPKVVSDLPPTSTDGDEPPTSTDGDEPPTSTDDKDEFPEPKPRVVSDLPPTSTDGNVPPMSTADRTEFPEPKPQGGVGVPGVA